MRLLDFLKTAGVHGCVCVVPKVCCWMLLLGSVVSSERPGVVLCGGSVWFGWCLVAGWWASV